MTNTYLRQFKIGVSVITGIFLPIIVFAQSYAPGTLVQEAGKPEIFYLAVDGQRYRFPNQATYNTWYRDFRRVKTLTSEPTKALPLAKEAVTVHPGTVLVKFTDAPEIYAVANGAVLRPLSREEVIRALYGYHWRERIVVLPSNLREHYTVGAPIREPSDFDRNRVIVAAKTIDQELSARLVGVLETTAVPATPNAATDSDATSETVYGPTLTALSTNLRTALRPGFHPDQRFYWLTADADEAALVVTAATEDPRARVAVAGTLVSGSSSIPVPLRLGTNQVSIKVTMRSGNERTYFLLVTRKKLDNNALLRSLTENLDADLDPAFHPSELKYTLRAAFDEQWVDLTPTADSQHATIRINGEPVGSWFGQRIPIGKDPVKVVIQVKAQSGNERSYEIVVYPQLVPSEATYLRSLEINLADTISPEFTPTRTRYYAQAAASEERVIVTARPWHRSAIVSIEDEEIESKSVRLFTGRNEIPIVVAVPSGQETTYTLTIDRAER